METRGTRRMPATTALDTWEGSTVATREEILDLLGSIEDNEHHLDELVQQVGTRVGVIPFVGAGLSADLGFPPWSKFLLGLAEKAGNKPAIEARLNKGEFEEAAEDLRTALGSRHFEDAIHLAYGDALMEGRKHKGAVTVLPDLAHGPVITTNFDHVLERVFAGAGCAFERECWGAKAGLVVRSLHQGARFLLKFHGDVDDDTERVLTKADYDRHYGSSDPLGIDRDKPLPKLLGVVMENRPLLFLGCSLGPDRTVEVLRRVTEGLPVIHYAVVSKPAVDESFREFRRSLSERGIRPIWYPEGRYELIETLLRYLVEQIPAHLRPVKARLGNSRRLAGPGDSLLRHRHGFYGRVAEVGNVLGFLESDGKLGTVVAAPEVWTVEGAPGIGKTETCKAALARYLERDPERVAYFVDLAGAALLSRLAEAFGVPQAVTPDQILGVIAGSPGLIYLDNLEDVLHTDPQTAVGFLEQLTEIPTVRVLASSRESLCGIGRTIPLDRLDPDSAVALFRREWHRARGKELADSPELRAFVKEDLDCHPLSIVLVGAQAKTRPDLGEMRRAWRTLGTKIARVKGLADKRLWNLQVSISLSLAAVERENPEAVKLWGLMGLFPEGMSSRAWEFLFRDRLDEAEEMRDLLIRLNLVEWGDQGMLRMLVPLRRFVLDTAKAEQAGLTCSLLAETAHPYFLWAAKEAQEHTFDDQHIRTLNILLEELANVCRFIQFAAELGDEWVRTISQLSRHLLNFYQFNALLGHETLGLLKQRQHNIGLGLDAVRSTGCLADLERRLGKVDDARTHYRDAIELYLGEQHNLGRANAIKGLADLERRLGKVDDAGTHYLEAIELYLAEQDNLGRANAILGLADLERDEGQTDDARTHYLDAIELYLAEQSNLGRANALRGLAHLERRLGKVDDARTHYLQAIELYLAEQHNLGRANALQGLADLERGLGHNQEARELYEEAIPLYRSEQAYMGLAYALSDKARTLHALGAHAQVPDCLKDALEAAQKSNTPAVIEYVQEVVEELGGT